MSVPGYSFYLRLKILISGTNNDSYITNQISVLDENTLLVPAGPVTRHLVVVPNQPVVVLRITGVPPLN